MSTLEKRFWEKVDRRGPTECWPWTAAQNGNGYGVIGIDHDKIRLATHVSLTLDGRPRPGAAWALHACDNRGCVNPAHLDWGDVFANNQQMHARGRWSKSSAKGTLNPASKLTEPDVLAIRASAEPRRTLAERYGITVAMISRILHRQAWAHI